MPATTIPFLSQSEPYWFADSFSGLSQPAITKMVLHSTETPPPNCPGYGGGAATPTVTVDPWNVRGWQHLPANMSARALVDSAGTAVRENRDNVAQIEIIGYADYRINAKYALANIPDAGLVLIARVLQFYNVEWGLPLRTTLEWPAFNSPRLNQVRLSGPAYDAYTGVLGHMHVSGNDHVDPAGLNIIRLMALANGGEDDMANSDEIMALLVSMDNRLKNVEKQGQRTTTNVQTDWLPFLSQQVDRLTTAGRTVTPEDIKAIGDEFERRLASQVKVTGTVEVVPK